MSFVPEGQHDSSQARSAWDYEENSLVPGGRSKALSVPEPGQIHSTAEALLKLALTDLLAGRFLQILKGLSIIRIIQPGAGVHYGGRAGGLAFDKSMRGPG